MRALFAACWCSFLFLPIAQAQSPLFDSLRGALKVAPDTTTFQTLKALASEFAYVDRDSASHYLARLTSFAERRGTANQKALTNLLNANNAYDRGDYATADSMSLLAIDAFAALRDTQNLARAQLNVGSIADASGDKPRAITYYLKAIDNFQFVEDTLNVAYTQLNVGLTFKSLAEYEKALDYYQQARQQLTAAGDAFGLATVNNNTGSLLVELAQYDSAYHYAAQSKKQYGALGYSLYEHFSVQVMADAAEQLGRTTEALQLLRTCIAVFEDNEAKEDLFTTYTSLARLHTKQKQFERSEKYGQLALKLAKTSRSTEDLRDAHNTLYQHYTSRANTAKALFHLEAFTEFADSISSVQKSQQVNELETRYRTAEQERLLTQQALELAENQTALAQRRNQLLWLGLGSILLLGIGVFAWQRSRFKAKEQFQLNLLQERKQGLKAVVEATENERARVSRELHDGVGQQLTAIRLGMEALSKEENTVGQQLKQLTNQFSQSAEEVRLLSHQMMPRSLMERGLIQAIEDLLMQSFQRYQSHTADTPGTYHAETTYSFEHRGIDQQLEKTKALTLYRILQELINNILKHAKAKNVDIVLYRTKQQLLLQVSDDGIGFDLNANANGHGLLNLKQRIDLVSGKISWESEPGRGTETMVTMPL